MSGTFEKKFPPVNDGKTNCVVSTGAFKFLKEFCKRSWDNQEKFYILSDVIVRTL